MKHAYASYHQIYLGDPEQEFEYPDDLVAVIAPGDVGGLIIAVGVAYGNVRYEAFTHSSEPAPADDGWEDVGEATVAAPRGLLHVQGPAGMSFDEDNLATNGAGLYAVRCSMKGRTLEYDLSVPEEAQESFRLDVWPVSTALPTRVLRERSGYSEL